MILLLGGFQGGQGGLLGGDTWANKRCDSTCPVTVGGHSDFKSSKSSLFKGPGERRRSEPSRKWQRPVWLECWRQDEAREPAGGFFAHCCVGSDEDFGFSSKCRRKHFRQGNDISQFIFKEVHVSSFLNSVKWRY